MTFFQLCVAECDQFLAVCGWVWVCVGGCMWVWVSARFITIHSECVMRKLLICLWKRFVIWKQLKGNKFSIFVTKSTILLLLGYCYNDIGYFMKYYGKEMCWGI